MEQNQRPAIDASEGFMDRGELVSVGAAAGMMPAVPLNDGETAVNIFGGVITAQHVAKKRDMADFKSRMMALAAFAGMDYVYSWEVNDRKNNRKVQVEGATIVLANDLAREWGNCQVDCRVIDQGRHWMFYGRFVDLQTGYSLTRGYQQRKAQDTGMKDDQRALDLVFQIGQSKCIRNVIVNALRTMADFCVEEAKKGLVERVKKNPEGAKANIVKKLQELGIDLKRVTAIYTRAPDNWTVYDMAKIWTEINSIAEGMIDAGDVYPTDEQRTANAAAGNATTNGAGVNGAINNQSAGNTDANAQQKQDVKPNPPQAAERKVIAEDGTDLGLGIAKVVAVGEVFSTGSGVRYEVVKFDEKIVVVKPAGEAATQQKAASKRGGKKTGATNLEQNQSENQQQPGAAAGGTTPPGAPGAAPGARPNLFGGDDD